MFHVHVVCSSFPLAMFPTTQRTITTSPIPVQDELIGELRAGIYSHLKWAAAVMKARRLL